MIEPISVGVHAVKISGDVAGKRVLVLGAGTIGNLVAQVAKALGAEQVLITDISPYKLEKARECGLENVCNSEEEDLEAKILEVFGPDRMDLTLECVGVQDTITQAIAFARKGSTIVVVGVFGEEPHVNLGFVQDRELKILGTLMYQRHDYIEAIRLLGEGLINLKPMITHRFKFDDYLAAYHTIEESGGKYMKVMIDI
jgi:L-iditol 2-dehydrogenase